MRCVTVTCGCWSPSFLVDQLGSWSFVVVISVYIFDRTHSTQWLAAAGICRWAPGLLLASYGGVIADRYERVTLLIVSSLASAALMTGMALVVAVDGPVSLILAFLALSAVVLAPYRPAAGALTPETVGEDDLVRCELHLLGSGEPRGGSGPRHRRPAAADWSAGHRRGDQRGQLRRCGRCAHPAASSFQGAGPLATAMPCSSWLSGSRRWRPSALRW